jgi:hypothetical protein
VTVNPEERPVRTLSRVLSVAAASTAAATALVGTGASAALAAPTHKGTTTVAPSAVTASVLEGVTGPAQLTAAGAVFGIVGNPAKGVIKHVGGITVQELDPTTPATSLTLSNFWIDPAAGTVSAVVDDGARVVVFTVGAGGALSFTATASQAITGGTALAGASAGTATVALR